jgi:DNA-binding MarR family transcriptional regulator
MSSISDKRPGDPDEPGAARRRRRLTNAVKDSMRDLRVQLAVLNHEVGERLKLKPVDIDCLDLLARNGAQSPSNLAKLCSLHPATMTGILDRLEKGAWVARDRDPQDRRAVVVRLRPERAGELLGVYSGMSGLMDGICGSYTDQELELIADFLRRAHHAGSEATQHLR